MKFFLQSLLLIFSFIVIFVWQNTVLSQYTIPALGFLIFIFLLTSARKKSLVNIGGNEPLVIFILNSVIFLFIFSTGGFSSTLFFLLYFLCFGIAFVFRPAAVFVFALGAFLVFLPDAVKENVMENMLKIGSLFLIAPLAYFFGREYRKDEIQQSHIEAMDERTKEAADTISKDVEEVLTSEKDKLKSQDVEKLNEILEETEDLREETKK